MTTTLNMIIFGLVGFIIGLLFELVLEILYFRRWRRQFRDERVDQLQATVRAKDARILDLETRLERAQERMNALQGEVARRIHDLEQRLSFEDSEPSVEPELEVTRQVSLAPSQANSVEQNTQETQPSDALPETKASEAAPAKKRRTPQTRKTVDAEVATETSASEISPAESA